ncbi:hypothetical protein CXB51_002071 [Gossypium anomalum]|uniref:GPI transamidase subunit PIG-U n=1 Tax=Gossypium anomalum TaxID=47600 RepID=A0A8J5ZI66_9ROSI|nr:hypothetical protein CXB51_002071 [Gossypium anomalum]
MEKVKKKIGSFSFWNWVIASIIFRLILIYFPKNLNLSSRPEVSTPLTSFRRLAEGYWLKQSSMSPYAGSMYHGSPLLLSLLGPLTINRIEGQPNHLLYSLVSVIADVVSAMLIRATGQNLRLAYLRSLESLDLVKQIEVSEFLFSGDIAALIYLCNPFTIVACMGLSTSPIENMAVILCLYGACSRLIPLAAFGWVIATHLSLYPAILIIPVIFLLGCGPDSPPRKLFLQRHQQKEVLNQLKLPPRFSWGPIIHFAFWAFLWSVYVLVLCGISLKQFGGLWEMFKSTYGFILTVEDLSPNIGVLWYFFAEELLFDSFPCQYFIYDIAISHSASTPALLLGFCIRCHMFHAQVLSISKFSLYLFGCSTFTVGDSALYLGLLGWFVNELAGKYAILSLPVLWICRVEGVSAMLNHDRKLRNLITGKPQDAKS